MWARLGAQDDDDDEVGEAGTINVSKAFRRLEAYAAWMEDAAADLTSSPLTAASVGPALAAFPLSTSYDDKGRLVWWVDMKAIDKKAVHAVPVEELFRMFVWYSHAVMYDANAQSNGIVFVENIASMGFWASMTLVPMSLGAKLDRLTIGILPVKMKLILMLDCPTWISAIMKVFGVFMSKKMKQRMVYLKKEWGAPAEHFGAAAVPAGFAECNGACREDPVRDAYLR